MRNYKTEIITVILVVIGFFVYLNFEEFEDGIIFYIAYLALIFTVMTSILNKYEERKRLHIRLIKGSCPDELSLNLSRELAYMNKKNRLIKDVQVIDTCSAIIIYI